MTGNFLAVNLVYEAFRWMTGEEYIKFCLYAPILSDIPTSAMFGMILLYYEDSPLGSRYACKQLGDA